MAFVPMYKGFGWFYLICLLLTSLCRTFMDIVDWEIMSNRVERTVRYVLIGWKERWSNVWRRAIKLAAEDSWKPEGLRGIWETTEKITIKGTWEERKYVISTQQWGGDRKKMIPNKNGQTERWAGVAEVLEGPVWRMLMRKQERWWALVAGWPNRQVGLAGHLLHCWPQQCVSWQGWELAI